MLRFRRYLTRTTTDKSVATKLVPVPSSSPAERFSAGLEEPTTISAAEGYGYYPAKLGQVLGHREKPNQYVILRKLGWGASSNVWLAHNTDPVSE